MAAKQNRKTKAAVSASEINEGLRRLSGILDIPPSAMSGVPQIELGGNREAVIDGCLGVLSYDESMIRLALRGMIAIFRGRSLQIRVLTHDSAILGGFIMSIEFSV